MQMWFINSHRWQKKMTKSTPQPFQVKPVNWLPPFSSFLSLPGDFDFKSLFIAADPIWQQQGENNSLHRHTCPFLSTAFSFLRCVEIMASLKVMEGAPKRGKKIYSLCMMTPVGFNAGGGVIEEVYLQVVAPTRVEDAVLCWHLKAVWSQRFPKCLFSPGISLLCETGRSSNCAQLTDQCRDAQMRSWVTSSSTSKQFVSHYAACTSPFHQPAIRKPIRKLGKNWLQNFWFFPPLVLNSCVECADFKGKHFPCRAAAATCTDYNGPLGSPSCPASKRTFLAFQTDIQFYFFFFLQGLIKARHDSETRFCSISQFC